MGVQLIRHAYNYFILNVLGLLLGAAFALRFSLGALDMCL